MHPRLRVGPHPRRVQKNSRLKAWDIQLPIRILITLKQRVFKRDVAFVWGKVFQSSGQHGTLTQEVDTGVGGQIRPVPAIQLGDDHRRSCARFE
jgi:hypothetical protein